MSDRPKTLLDEILADSFATCLLILMMVPWILIGVGGFVEVILRFF